MGERKVLNKYYPADFDPAKIPRRRQPLNQQMKVRMMLPMTIRCIKCSHYIYKGTKFNSRKEDVFGETHLGIQIFRFYFKCPNCSAEMTFKTDPQNSDYIVESGATRNFETWRAGDEELKKRTTAEETGDSMKSLENRNLDSKREMLMDILAALDEMKSMKSRQATVSVDAMLEALQRSNKQEERKMDEEDEALIKSVFQGQRADVVCRRINDEDDDDNEGTSAAGPLKRRKTTDSSDSHSDTDKLTFKSSAVRVSVVKKSGASNKPPNGLQSICLYGGSDKDDHHLVKYQLFKTTALLFLAISRYICDKYASQGNKGLYGTNPLEKASIDQWLEAESQSFNPPSSVLVFQLAFAPRMKIKQNEAKLAKVLDVYDKRLGESRYLAGDEFSLADLSHLPNSGYLVDETDRGELFESRKNVERWWAEISSRESWTRVVEMRKSLTQK
ncbi:hypothetical protein CASFOL_016011 [Castilleja foliolosa]|uniref:Splicing factor YJU2 n=1 Tax=Castilleja foliolosa TaxID=1961234 RepID=A0ABD3DG05_9LAMI